MSPADWSNKVSNRWTITSLLRGRLGGLAHGGKTGLAVLVYTGLESTEVHFYKTKSKFVLSSEFLN